MKSRWKMTSGQRAGDSISRRRFLEERDTADDGEGKDDR
jgi:hypothetical protein